jgi:tetratricopeptide (TPR) repeat protein
MTLGSLCITGIALLAWFPLPASGSPQTQPSLQGNSAPSATIQVPKGRDLFAPVPPTLAQMRAMNATELDEAGDRMRVAKDYLAALDCYREAIRRHPEAAYYNKIAITQIMLRHPEEAQKAAKKAVRKDKHMAEAWNNLGVSYYLLGSGQQNRSKTEDAIRTYERAISITPDNASFHNNLAAALMDIKEYDRGMAEYRKAFALDPGFFERSASNGVSARMGSPEDRAQFAFVMARLFAAAGDTDRVLHFLRAAMEDGYPKIDDVYREKEFEPVLQDQRFLALMKDRPVAVR